ncbi:hypothetical protein K2173_014889 [Erythroxylum novogranatense]|uniref:BHLH domain-containing protein n=1 Tax=Erythroxylum novogranatense TaxID=1862640 RepID=A0AAV8TG32_9ROSI|nr:hypothetical protein K2173_014889 [Erythroxylum novogranatense]
MRRLASYCAGGGSSLSSGKMDFRNSVGMLTNYEKSLTRTVSKEEAQAIAPEKHKLSERNRRVRIASQFAALRAILPNLTKRNKASVLAEAIKQVRELEKVVSELRATRDSSRDMECAFPGGRDTLRVENSEKHSRDMVKVMFNCKDKRMLMSNVGKAVNSVGGKVVRAEMATVGGRTGCALWIQGIKGNQEMIILRSALAAVTQRM